LSEQLTGLSLAGDTGGSSSSSASSSKGFATGGCFRLLESHGDQVGGYTEHLLLSGTHFPRPHAYGCAACAMPGFCSSSLRKSHN
jgi:hypothetical protein